MMLDGAGELRLSTDPSSLSRSPQGAISELLQHVTLEIQFTGSV